MAALDLDAIHDGLVAGQRAAISRAITLVESSRPDHRAAARDLLARLAQRSAEAEAATVRIGISGVPGVGKSTFIESLGTWLTGQGHHVGVLAVDPSSVRTGGSVLGDKTRMPQLSVDRNAFIRPSPTAGTLGGVAAATSQAMTVLEGAGYDVILVETVGVGQSEITVAGMVDTFLFLTLSRTGDQLQGIKKGILEIADVITVNKADSQGAGGVDRQLEARVTARELAGALRMVRGHDEWAPPVITSSGLTGGGVSDVWDRIMAHRAHLGEAGLTAKRAQQQLDFTWSLVRDTLNDRLRRSEPVREIREAIRERVLSGELSAPAAADEILAAFDRG